MNRGLRSTKATSRYAPSLVYQMPDPDAAKKAEEYAKNEEAFFAAVENYKKNGFEVTQDVIDALAAKHGVTPPTLAKVVPTSFTLAPTDLAKVIRVREARASAGQQPFGDERDDMTITELDEFNKAKAAAPSAPGTPLPAHALPRG